MNSNLLLYPLIAQLLLILIVLVIVAKRRFIAAKSGQLPVAKIKTMQLDDVDASLIVCGKNFDNQFQLPMLFMMLVLFSIQFAQVDLFLVAISWAFVIARYCHSYIHMGSNNVKWRFYIFGLGGLLVFAGWTKLLLAIL